MGFRIKDFRFRVAELGFGLCVDLVPDSTASMSLRNERVVKLFWSFMLSPRWGIQLV